MTLYERQQKRHRRSEEHTSELQSHRFISYAVFCLKKTFFNDTATTEIYTLSLHDALPISLSRWCHPTISSSAVPFSSCPQSFPESGSFQMSNWRLITLQYCSGFCHTLTWIGHVSPILKPLLPTSPSHPSGSFIPVHQPWAPCLMHQTWTGNLYHIW